jgi:hypothetical protein
MSLRGCLLGVAVPLVSLLVFAGHLYWRSSDWALPPIAQGMQSGFEQGDALFKERVRSRYPIGTSERTLIGDLQRQGFTLSPDRSHADLKRFIGCGDKVWSVRWRAHGGKVAEVIGLFYPNCL